MDMSASGSLPFLILDINVSLRNCPKDKPQGIIWSWHNWRIHCHVLTWLSVPPSFQDSRPLPVTLCLANRLLQDNTPSFDSDSKSLFSHNVDSILRAGNAASLRWTPRHASSGWSLGPGIGCYTFATQADNVISTARSKQKWFEWSSVSSWSRWQGRSQTYKSDYHLRWRLLSTKRSSLV